MNVKDLKEYLKELPDDMDITVVHSCTTTTDNSMIVTTEPIRVTKIIYEEGKPQLVFIGATISNLLNPCTRVCSVHELFKHIEDPQWS